MKPSLIQPEDAIGKTVKDVFRDDTWILTVYEGQTYTLIAADFGSPSEDGRLWPTFATEDEVSLGTVCDIFLSKHGFFTDREIENWYSGN
jgi:hypothetical protein